MNTEGFCRIADLLDLKRIKTISPTFKLTNNEILDIGEVPVISQDKEFIAGYSNSIDNKLLNPPYVLFGDHTECFKWADFPFAQGADGLKIFKCDENYVLNRFLYYSLISCYNRTGFYERHFKMLRRTYIPDYSIDKQKQIVHVLSKYDELISNNKKRILVLEKMISELYKEWFIRFRYSGFENKDKHKIPDGWKYIKFDELCDYQRGISYSSEDLIENENSVNLINLKNLRDYGGFRKENIKSFSGDYKENQKLNKGDLIMGITEMVQERRIIGYCALIPTYSNFCVMSADLIKIISDYNNYYLYCCFTYGFYSKCFSNFGNGTNVIHLRPSSLKNIKILVPPKSLVDQFASIVSSYFEEIDLLQLKNENLENQKNMLLPRLIFGNLDTNGKEII